MASVTEHGKGQEYQKVQSKNTIYSGPDVKNITQIKIFNFHLFYNYIYCSARKITNHQ